MTTEILGFIIILGAVIVLLARQHLNKSEDDPEVLEAATGRLRYELEQSADEIINRMTEHVDRLERMLREADYKAELLQQKIDMLQSMGNMDVKMPATDLDMEETTPAAVYAGRETATANNAEESYDMTPSDEKAWEYIREASMKLEAQYEAQSNTMQSVQQSDALQQAVDIQTGNLDSLVSAGGNAKVAQTVNNVGKGEQLPYNTDEGQGLDTEVATKAARDMLADGYELEEIAKATGLGIGAVHLIKQLQEKHQ